MADESNAVVPTRALSHTPTDLDDDEAIHEAGVGLGGPTRPLRLANTRRVTSLLLNRHLLSFSLLPPLSMIVVVFLRVKV